jgi:hypothetical protein
MLYSKFGDYGFLEVRRKEFVSIRYKLSRYAVEFKASIDYRYYYL